MIAGGVSAVDLQIDWDAALLGAVALGFAPSEFWNMGFAEYVMLAEQMRPPAEGDYAGGLRAADLDAIMEVDFDALMGGHA